MKNSLSRKIVGLSMASATLAVPAVASTIGASSASAATTTTSYTIYSNTNVRTGGSLSSSVATTVNKGVAISGTVSGGWMHVTSPASLAGKYISTSVLSTTKPASTTSTSNSPVVQRYTIYNETNIRTGGSLSASVATTVGAGTQVTGYIQNGWLHITSGTYSGKYVSTTVLSATPPVTSTTTVSTDIDGGTMGTGYVLYSGDNGVKVYLARKALGLSYSTMSSTMDSQTINAVANFQRAHGLTANGVIDTATWNKLNTGYSFNVDNWQKSSDVAAGASPTTRVNAMVAFAKSQIGKPYIWGGTGPMGYDCSGFLLQVARAGGMKPVNVSNYTDVRPASDLSNQMLHDPEFIAVPLSQIRRGDFIYYGNTTSTAHHVSMYLGDGTVINAVGPDVHISDYSNNFGWAMKIGANRAVKQ